MKESMVVGEDRDRQEKIEALLQAPCFVIDILPQRVGRARAEQYFAVERHYSRGEEKQKLVQKWTDLLLKVSCYHDYEVCFHGVWRKNPAPHSLAQRVKACVAGTEDDLKLLIDGGLAMIVVSKSDLHMSVYHPDERLTELLSKLASAEGLFFWEAGAEPECADSVGPMDESKDR